MIIVLHNIPVTVLYFWNIQYTYDLKIDMNLHSDEKPYQCYSCNKVFSNDNLNLKHVINSEEKQYQCHDCYNNTDLTHTGDKVYLGSECRKKLTSSGNNYQFFFNNLFMSTVFYINVVVFITFYNYFHSLGLVISIWIIFANIVKKPS